MKTYFFVTVLLACLCLSFGLRPRPQNHKFVNAHLRETMPLNQLQRHEDQMVSPSITQAPSQSYRENEMESDGSSYNDGSGYQSGSQIMRNRHHLIKEDVHDEYSVRDYDYDDDDQLNGNQRHNQNDLDEPNNGERRYYVDDNDLRRKFTQEETSSINPGDYIDYNKEARPQAPQHGPYPYNNNKFEMDSRSTSSDHDHGKIEQEHNAVKQQVHHDFTDWQHKTVTNPSLII